MQPLGTMSRMDPPGAAVAVDTVRSLRILVVNSKGGCGKTSLATNLVAFYASHGLSAALFDYDPQGSATQWLGLRDREPAIHGVTVSRRSAGQTLAFQMRVPEATRRIVLDAPAGVAGTDLVDLVRRADVILVPVLPSPFDMNSTAHFIRDLLLVGRVRARAVRVGVVANRVKTNTQVYRGLMRFLDTLQIPVVGRLRDSQSYVRAAENGLGVHELRDSRRDLAEWKRIVRWLEGPAGQ